MARTQCPASMLAAAVGGAVSGGSRAITIGGLFQEGVEGHQIAAGLKAGEER